MWDIILEALLPDRQSPRWYVWAWLVGIAMVIVLVIFWIAS